jgi:hypothetical protein
MPEEIVSRILRLPGYRVYASETEDATSILRNTVRPHQALAQNCPRPRDVPRPALGRVVAIPHVGGFITTTARGVGWSYCAPRRYRLVPAT